MVGAVEESAFRGVLVFFNKIGIYDVVLPFLLVFTIVFAILEKTKVFGTEKVLDIKGKERDVTRKNLNAMAAFVTAFFVIASTRMVAIINEFVANVVLLLLLAVCFLMLAGSLSNGKGVFELKGGWKTTFMVLLFIGIIVVFLNAIGWLQKIYEFIFFKFNTVTVSSIVLVIIIIGFVIYVTGGEKTVKPKKDDD